MICSGRNGFGEGASFDSQFASSYLMLERQTLQTIAFSAWLRERSPAPFMVVCPLSVLHNWASEYQRFAPEVRAIVKKAELVLIATHRSQSAFTMERQRNAKRSGARR